MSTETADHIQKETTEALRLANRARVLEYLTLMGSWDRSKASAADGGYAEGRYPDFYAPTGLLEIPFMPPGLSKTRQGRAAHAVDAEFRFSLFREFAWELPLEIHDCLDPNTFIVFASSKGVTVRGDVYENDYVFFIELADGKIVKMKEYADPGRTDVLADCFPSDSLFRN